MRRVVADQPGALGAWSRHDVEVVQVVARSGHRRSVPSVGHQDDVAGPDLGEHVDLAVCRAVDAQVPDRVGALGRAVGGLDLVVVDLLQLRLDAVAVGVVLVRRVRAPVAGRGDDLAGDERLGLEHAGHPEVADLAGRLAGSAQLDRDVGRAEVLEARNRPDRLGGHDGDGEGDPARLGRLEHEVAVAGDVRDVGGSVEDRGAAGQPHRRHGARGLGAPDLDRPGERNDHELAPTGRQPALLPGPERTRIQSGVLPALDALVDDHRPVLALGAAERQDPTSGHRAVPWTRPAAMSTAAATSPSGG